MKHRDFLITALRTALVLPLMLVLCTAVSGAAERDWPKPAIEGEELAKIRAWEKEWVGKRVDLSNLDQVKEYVPQTYIDLWTKLGDRYWFEIKPYQWVPPSKGDIKQTKNYNNWDTVTVDENEVMQGYISGRPFPDPETGAEMMYNADNKNWGDSMLANTNAWIIDGKRGYDRQLLINGHMLWFSGRRDVEPIPEFAPNPKQIYRISNSTYQLPASLKGNVSCNIVWKDRSRDWGSYSWSSATRRITRRSTNMRQSTVAGTDVTYNDDACYSWVINHNTYKLGDTKNLLLVRHLDVEQVKELHIEGYVLQPGEQREMVKVQMIECKNKDPNYVYGKEIFYYDTETGWLRFADKYDRRGNFWKTIEVLGYVLKSATTDNQAVHLAMQNVTDHVRNHATIAIGTTTIGLTDKRFQPPYYGPKAMQKQGY